jgi:hypothetical protein
VKAIPWRDIDSVGPAGSINSSARDVAKWIAFQLRSDQRGELVRAGLELSNRRPVAAFAGRRVERAFQKNAGGIESGEKTGEV